MAALYSAQLKEFLTINPEQLLGKLVAGLANEGFDTNKLTTSSWQQEIEELQKALRELALSLHPAAGLRPFGRRLDLCH